ncbi:DUF2059 domain-containing protein [Paracoccus onubensis]|uniref:DUF2059 domain-containing protein n=2 Tax=Paracoccus onubensis TaxID=1675788 RepID=A0A418SQ72_9RHOB|nr:DUF2059 domain-containing protein [Paracoccus onubensis]
MLRMIFLAVGIAAGLPAMVHANRSAPVAEVQTLQARLWQVLQLGDLMPIIRKEALTEAVKMQDSLFQRGGDNRWEQIVAQIHETGRLEQLLRDGLQEAVADEQAALIEEALAFYETSLGQRLIGLETSAREVILDMEAEADAKANYAHAAGMELPRIAQIKRLIDKADLIAPNVAGGMNAALAFSRGFNEGGGYPMPMSEAQMLSDAWAHEASLRAETLDWMEAYLFLAYSPLSDAELDRYIEFAGSSAGQALADTLFGGFDKLFEWTSYEMGLAAAGQIQGRRL